jgi:AcrR family transcriptional regulator
MVETAARTSAQGLLATNERTSSINAFLEDILSYVKEAGLPLAALALRCPDTLQKLMRGSPFMSAAHSAGVQPKRQRGHVRVAAIMKAGVDVFTEKGFDAATMTEIAERSGTATASLYRFFPSKDALADALLLQYAQHALYGLAALRARAAGMALDDIADALVVFRLTLQSERRFAVDLAEARGGSDEQRREFRRAMLGGVAGLVRTALPALSKAKADAMAIVLLHILKGVSAIDQEKPAARRMLLNEIRQLVCAYLASARHEGDAH